ncbi:MAG: ATP-binding protein, partial [Corynebacterium casei]
MALESCKTIALEGVIAHIVDIEANIGAGLPGIHVVGRTDTAISESRQRIKTAIINSKLAWPKTKIVVSLSPASLPKSGSHFDLPLAVAILLAGMKAQDEQLAADGYATWGNESFAEKTATTLFLGELGLDGSIRPVPGILSAMVAAQKHGYHTLVIPPGNAGEAQLVEDTRVLVAHNLREVFEWLRGNRNLTTPEQIPSAPRNHLLDFADIAGQHEAKFAAEVAAAGGHHLMM